MIRIRKFDESIESERQIKKISERYISVLAEKTYDAFMQWSDSKRYNDNLSVMLLDRKGRGSVVSIDFDSVKYPKFLEDFFKHLEYDPPSIRFYMGVYFIEKRIGGNYSPQTKDINVFVYNERVLSEMIDVFKKYNNQSRIVNQFERILDGYNSILVHELTHAYDDYISSGKFMPKDYKSIGGEGDDWEEYASQNLEVNARYASTIAKLTDMGVKYTLDFDGVLDEFKRRFQGWNTISNEQQKRLTNRLYAWYTEPIEGKREKNKALKYIYNNASFKQLYEIADSTFQKFKNSRVKIPDNLKNTDFPEIDVVSYIKESAQQLIEGNYDRKEIKNPAIVRNRYSGFKAVEHLIDQKDKYAQMVNDIESENLGVDIEELLDKNPKYKMMHKSWQKALDKISNLSKQLEVSEDSLYTIAKRFE